MSGPCSDDDDGGCTASVGVMGHKSCHMWPGCGCGEDDPTPSEPDYRPPNDLGGLRIDAIPALGRSNMGLRDWDREIARLRREATEHIDEKRRLEQKIRLLREFIKETIPDTPKSQAALRKLWRKLGWR